MATTSEASRTSGALLGLSAPTCRTLHRVAVTWSLAAIGGLALSGPLDLLDHRPGGGAFEISERPIFMALFAIGVLTSLRWRIVGATIASFTASALVVFASQQLQSAPAAAVIFAFSIPALLWILIDLNAHRPRTAILGLALAVTAIGAGGVTANAIYDGLFGPTHPSSQTAPLPSSGVKWIWSGAVTETSFSVTARVSDEAKSVRLLITDGTDPVQGISSPQRQPDNHGIVRFEIGALNSDTGYLYAVEIDDVVDRVRIGSVRTFPSGPASFTVAIGSDARVGSNGAVFDAITELDPLLYLIPGDLHYANITKPRKGQFEDVLDLTLSRPGPAALYRSTPVAYVWDDHDFGGNDSDGTTPSAEVAHEIFRRYVPHYPLAGSASPVYQAFTIGRVRFILTDGRSARTPASHLDDSDKTMLGAEQKEWLKRELLDAKDKYVLTVWVNPLPWITAVQPGADDWGGYSTERSELANFISDNAISALMMLSGDAHMLAIDDGSNSGYSADGTGGFPIMHSAALDRPGSVKGGPFSEGTVPGGGHFGLLEITDNGGDVVEVSLSGRDWTNEELIAFQFSMPSGPEPPTHR